MERLTKHGAITQRDIDELFELSDENQFGRNEAYFRLQHYEDVEEAGETLYERFTELVKATRGEEYDVCHD